MTCAGWQELILDKESLDDLQRRELHQHVSNCMDCRAWAKAFDEMEAMLAEELNSAAKPSDVRALVLHAVARERRQPWMAAVPELLDGLGWGALGVLGMAGIALWTNWARLDNPLLWMSAAAVAGSVAWAGGVLQREKSEAGLVL